MRKLHLSLLAAAILTGPAVAQTPAPAPAAAPAKAAATAPAAGTVKAVQPGLFEVAGPRVNDVIGAGIQKITATPDKGGRAIAVQSPWGFSYHPWPKTLKPVTFTIDVGKPMGGATISAPGYTEANKADYKAAIDAIIPYAIARTQDAKSFAERPGGH